MNSNSVKEFEALCEEKRGRGLVDLKFCTLNSSKLTPEEFCEQANAIDKAIDRGDAESFKFNDAKPKK